MVDPETDLTGQVLIAMPGMGDPRFEHSVVYLCAHTDEGAMGLIINKPVGADAKLSQLIEELNLPSPPKRDLPLHFGGPVEPGRGFVLHSPDFSSPEGTKEVSGAISMTATVDILEMIARGEGPEQAILTLGYSGWGPGQVESEILANGWLTATLEPELLFDSNDGDKWLQALGVLGVDPISLSTSAGRA